YGLGAGELWRTESLRAIIAQDILRTGNWIVPTLYGQPLLTKPPGLYAAIALVSWPFGEVREWTARLPSALAATATVLLFPWHFGRQLGRRAGLIAGLVLPLSLMWLDKVPTAEIDMLQTFWVSAAIIFFLQALEIEEESGQWTVGSGQWTDRPLLGCPLSTAHYPLLWWLAAMLALAGGVLTKWTAPVFFYLTVVPLLGWQGRLRLLLGRGHLLGLLLAIGLCSTWVALAAGQVG